MTEHEVFETRLRSALARHVANGPAEFDALAFARAVATAEPRRRGPRGAIATVVDSWRADRRPWWSILAPSAGWSPALRVAWIVAVTGLLLAATVSAVLVGSELLRRANDPTLVPPSIAELTIDARPGGVAAVAWSPAGDRLATVGYDGTVRTWDAVSGGALTTFRLAASFGAGAPMAFSRDGTHLALGMKIYEAATGEELLTLPEAFMAFSPDGTRVATAGDYGWAYKYVIGDAATGDALHYLGLGSQSGISGSRRPSMAWSPDGLRVAGTFGGGITVRDATTGEKKLSIISGFTEPPGSPNLHGIPTDVAWSPDGTMIAGAGGLGTARIWDAATGEVVASLRHPAAVGLTAIAWSPDGTRVATAGYDHTARIWDPTTGAELAILTGHASGVTDVAWSPDGTHIATAGDDGTVQVREAPRVAEKPSHVSPPPTAAPGANPAPMATPVALPPIVLEPLGEPTASDTALGRIIWQRYASSYGFLQLTGTSHGPVASGRSYNELLWLGRDGNWEGLALPWPVPPLTWDGRELFTSGSGRPRGLSWDGDRWTVGDVLDVPDAVRPVEEVASGPRGTIVFGGRRAGEAPGAAGFAIAHDGRSFVATARPPVAFDQVAPLVLATRDGFVVLATTDPMRSDLGPLEPVPWFTADGLTWDQAAPASPFGERASLYDVAGRDGRFVAVGYVGDREGPWAAWASDDGVAWDRVLDLGPAVEQDCNLTASACPVEVTAGDAGWVIYSKDGSAWASTDGRTWEPIDGWPAVRGEGLAVPKVALAGDTIVLVGYTDSDASDVVVGTIEP